MLLHQVNTVKEPDNSELTTIPFHYTSGSLEMISRLAS